jgi:hypothetical protein
MAGQDSRAIMLDLPVIFSGAGEMEGRESALNSRISGGRVRPGEFLKEQGMLCDGTTLDCSAPPDRRHRGHLMLNKF